MRARLTFILLLATAAAAAAIQAGQTRDEVAKELGRPQAEMKAGTRVFLTYPAGELEFQNGKLVKVPPGFAAAHQESIDKAAYANTQRGKGLELYNGTWMPKANADRLRAEDAAQKAASASVAVEEEQSAAAGPRGGRSGGGQGTGPLNIQAAADIHVLENGGAEIDLGSLAVPGHITLVEFYDKSSASKAMSKRLEQLTGTRGDLSLREVDIVDFNSPVAKQFNMAVAPLVYVLDRNGQQTGQRSDDISEIQSNINRAR